ncbi:MAG: hypothetical protein RBG13Loki_0864 [Promethearchaeota archaeon CR_4]|nr:MAG: hypothetical protein RBG13Loki_0864 [Candidatus Lokiarchaeota archaeon CR_4]
MAVVACRWPRKSPVNNLFSYFYQRKSNCTVSKTLVILTCSQKKGLKPAAARDLYQGSLFKLGRKFAEVQHFDYMIISAKYGLLLPEQVISPYDQRISNMSDVRRIRETVLPQLREILPLYEKIIMIGGSYYRKVLEPIKSAKFEIITDSRGIGGILQQLKRRIASIEE